MTALQRVWGGTGHTPPVTSAFLHPTVPRGWGVLELPPCIRLAIWGPVTPGRRPTAQGQSLLWPFIDTLIRPAAPAPQSSKKAPIPWGLTRGIRAQSGSMATSRARGSCLRPLQGAPSVRLCLQIRTCRCWRGFFRHPWRLCHAEGWGPPAGRKLSLNETRSQEWGAAMWCHMNLAGTEAGHVVPLIPGGHWMHLGWELPYRSC